MPDNNHNDNKKHSVLRYSQIGTDTKQIVKDTAKNFIQGSNNDKRNKKE